MSQTEKTPGQVAAREFYRGHGIADYAYNSDTSANWDRAAAAVIAYHEARKAKMGNAPDTCQNCGRNPRDCQGSPDTWCNGWLPTVQEIATLRARVAELEARNAEWEAFRGAFHDLTYHHQGMGCGIEDRGIHDRYKACEHGWDCAMEQVSEQMPEEVGDIPAPAPTPDVVPVPREEWEVWQQVKSAVLRLDEKISADEWDTVLIGVVRSIRALRSGESRKTTATKETEND